MIKRTTVNGELYREWVCESPWGPDSKHIEACACGRAECGMCNADTRFNDVFDPSNLVAFPEDRL